MLPHAARRGRSAAQHIILDPLLRVLACRFGAARRGAQCITHGAVPIIPKESPRDGFSMQERFHPARVLKFARRRVRRYWLNYGFFWVGAVLVGLVAVLFARWGDMAQLQFERWIEGRAWLALIITPALTAACVWLTRKFFAGSEGSGIPQVIAALHAPHRLKLIPGLFGLRIIVGKIGIGLMGLLGGLTIGREGPTVHVGASIMYEMRRFYPRTSPKLERSLLLAGAAAGLSGAFNTPLAGIVFAIEEVARSFEARTNGTLITAIVLSGLVSLALAGNYLYFGEIDTPDLLPLSFAVPALFAAVLCGVGGGCFNLSLLHQSRWIRRSCSRYVPRGRCGGAPAWGWRSRSSAS